MAQKCQLCFRKIFFHSSTETNQFYSLILRYLSSFMDFQTSDFTSEVFCERCRLSLTMWDKFVTDIKTARANVQQSDNVEIEFLELPSTSLLTSSWTEDSKRSNPCTLCVCGCCGKDSKAIHEHLQPTADLPTKLLPSCDLCSKSFSSKGALVTHKRSVHMQCRPFVCELCGLTFSTKSILSDHVNVHSDDRPYQCDHCGKCFKTKYRIKYHMDTHYDTKYECPVCHLPLNTKRTLRIHLALHAEEKRFHCTVCKKPFRRAKDVKVHMTTHTGAKPYTCHFCSRAFSNSSNCRSHKKRMHGEQMKLLGTSRNSTTDSVDT